jgi:predicted Rossmann-fold nucleotide-binding protein
MVVAMYGSHFDGVSDVLETQVDTFFQDLTHLIPAKHLAVTHGNMAGVMAMADTLAQKHDIMSLGVGLDLSAVGQKEVNLACDGFLFLESNERLYRQEKLDKLNTISVFNVGGYGTLEELFITVCSQKLTSRLPTPSILVAPDDLYDMAKELISEVGVRGLGQTWVSNTIHPVKTYEEAHEVIKGFWDDPKAYWEKAGIAPKDIALGYQKHQAVLEQMGMRLADNLREASEAYGTLAQ